MITNNVTLNPFNMYCTFQKKRTLKQDDYLCTVFNWELANGVDLDFKVSIVTGLTDDQSENFGFGFNTGNGHYGNYNTDDTGPSEQSEIAQEILYLKKYYLQQLCEKNNWNNIKIIIRAHWYAKLNNGQFTLSLISRNQEKQYECYSLIQSTDTTSNIYFTNICQLFYYPFTDTYTINLLNHPFCVTPATDNITNIAIIKSDMSTTDNNIQLQYKFKNTSNWEDYTIGNIIALNKNDQNTSAIYFKNLSSIFSSKSCIYQLTASKDINVFGQLNSLNNFSNKNQNYGFIQFFNNINIIDSKDLYLRTAGTFCYQQCFKNCIKLKSAPQIVHNQILNNQFLSCFYNCSSLLNTNNLFKLDVQYEYNENCFKSMFENCTSLTSISIPINEAFFDETFTKNWVKNINTCGNFITTNDVPYIFGDSYIPISWTLNGKDEHLCFTALENDVTLSLNNINNAINSNIYYAQNNNKFEKYTDNAVITLKNKNDYVKFLNLTNILNYTDKQNQEIKYYYSFNINNGKVKAENNILSLLNYISDTSQSQTQNIHYSFYSLFENCTSLIEANILNSNILPKTAYTKLFTNCSSLSAFNIPFNDWPADGISEWTKNVAKNGNVIKSNRLPIIFGDNYLPNNWLINNEFPFLNITAKEDNTIIILSSINNPTIDQQNIQYNKNNTTWNKYNINQEIKLNTNQLVTFFNNTGTLSYSEDIDSSMQPEELQEKIALITDFNDVIIYNDNDNIISSIIKYYKFVINKPATINGEINSLINFNTNPGQYSFYKLFYNCDMIRSTPTFNTISGNNKGIYQSLFQNCNNLQKCNIIYNELQTSSYVNMFKNCTSLSSIDIKFTEWTDLSENFNPTINWVNGVAINGNFNCPSTLVPKFGNDYIPDNWTINNKLGYLTFTALQNNTQIVLSAINNPQQTIFKYKINNNLFNIYIPNTIITLQKNDTISFINTTYILNTQQAYYNFRILNGKMSAAGNINSLINYQYDEENQEFLAELPNYIFYKLFENCTNLISVPDLNFNNLSIGCCKNMFKNCTSLTSNIVLSANELYESCYESMFEGCSSITTINTLGFTNTAVSSCINMFKNCTSLTSNIVLSADELYESCYESMFEGCSSITTINNLGFTNTSNCCCKNMFKNCTSLTSNIKLLSESLGQNCYQSMFEGCSKVNSITVSFDDWNEDENSTLNWLKDVASQGTFYYTDDALPLSTGVSYIPAGWTTIKIQK